MKRIVLTVAVLASFTLSCSDTERPDVDTTSAEKITRDGIGDIRLGDDYSSIFSKYDAHNFNPVSVVSCADFIEARGCDLFSKEDSTDFLVRNGVGYALELSLNDQRRITDISLVYERRSGVSYAECEKLFARSLDWLVTDYGRFYSSGLDGVWSERKTEQGNDYRVSQKRDSMIIDWRRTGPSPRPGQPPGLKWGSDRYVTVMAVAIDIGDGPTCDVRIEFSEPESIRRSKRSNHDQE